MLDNSIDLPTYADIRFYGNPITDSLSPRTESRYIDQNNQRSILWNISLTDDQDTVSKHFLRMYNDPIVVIEKFGPAILMVPENIRTQADELFKLSKNNRNEIFDMPNDKVSWILTSTYKKYLDSIPQNEMEKNERHMLYPWAQWSAMMGMQQHFSLPNGVVALSDRSFTSSSSSSPYAAYGRLSNNSNNSNNLIYNTSVNNGNNSMYNTSNNNSIYNTSNNNSSSNNSVYNTPNNNSFGYYGGIVAATTTADTSPIGDLNGSHAAGMADKLVKPYWTSPTQFRFTPNNSYRDDGHQRSQPQTVRSPSDSGRSVSSTDMYDDRSPPPSTTAAGSSSRLYYCVNTDNNTINKLVEHYCTFCYKNHEPPEVYGTHLVRDATRTTCPQLRALRCKHCNGTGDNAHTIKYCPFLYSNYTC